MNGQPAQQMPKRLQLLVTLRGHTGTVWSVSWSPRGLLASCGSDRTVRIWGCVGGSDEKRYDKDSWHCLAKLSSSSFQRTLREITWAPDGRTLAAAGFDALATILKLTKKADTWSVEAIAELPGHSSEIKSARYASSGAVLATASRDRRVCIWEAGDDYDYECIEELYGHNGDVKKVVWHPHIELLLSCSYDDTIRVWAEDLDEWYCMQELVEHRSTVWDGSFDRDGVRFVSAGADGRLIVWRRFLPAPGKIGAMPRFRIVGKIESAHAREVFTVDWSPSSGFIASGGGDDCIRVFAEQGYEDGSLKEFSEIDEDGNVIEQEQNDNDRRSADEDDTVKEGDQNRASHKAEAEEYICIAGEPRAHTGDVNCVAWYPTDGRFLASAGDDGLIRLWKIPQ